MNVIEYLQDVLIGKMREVPADDIEKVREYIKEIKALNEATDDPCAAADDCALAEAISDLEAVL